MNQQQQVSLRILSITFNPAGRHAQQYSRPFVPGIHDIRQNFMARYHALQLSPKVLGPVSSPKGNTQWDDEVSYFTMEVEVDYRGGIGKSRLVVGGYTDRLVPPNVAEIDPTTQLTINSIFKGRLMPMETPDGPGAEWVIESAQQVLADENHEGDYEKAIALNRPVDIASALTRLCDPMLTGHGVTAFDTRSMLTNAPVLSKYGHSDVFSYMNTLAVSKLASICSADIFSNRGVTEKYMVMARESRDEAAQRNPLLWTMSRLHGVVPTRHISFGQLLGDSPEATVASTLVEFDTTSAPMDGSDERSWLSSAIANLVPATMADAGVRAFEFDSMVVDSRMYIIDKSLEGVFGPISEEDRKQFICRLEKRLLTLMDGGVTTYEVVGKFDLFGNSRFKLGRGSSREWYVSPTWANARFSPLITTRPMLDSLAQHLDSILGQLLLVAFSDEMGELPPRPSY